MIVGIMSIMMCGGIYAPLNPNDSLDRLDSLVRQVNGKLVLVNQLSSSSHLHQLNVPLVDIDKIMNCNDSLNNIQIEQLSEVKVTPDSISHLVFTSGSTGIPKGVQLRHRNFISYVNAHVIEENDIILQLASSSFDVHLDEINSTLIQGAHLILLKSGGHLDFDYVTNVIHNNHVTFVAPVPSWIDALNKFLIENHHAQHRVKKVHWWFLGGEQLLGSTIRRFLPFVGKQCHILNTYGPAEITETATYYEVRRDELSKITSIPIGRPLDGYQIYLLDEYRQLVVPGQQGEIVVGGKLITFRKRDFLLILY
jgi:fengycin family lipopeptide synthetase D